MSPVLDFYMLDRKRNKRMIHISVICPTLQLLLFFHPPSIVDEMIHNHTKDPILNVLPVSNNKSFTINGINFIKKHHTIKYISITVFTGVYLV